MCTVACMIGKRERVWVCVCVCVYTEYDIHVGKSWMLEPSASLFHPVPCPAIPSYLR